MLSLFLAIFDGFSLKSLYFWMVFPIQTNFFASPPAPQELAEKGFESDDIKAAVSLGLAILGRGRMGMSQNHSKPMNCTFFFKDEHEEIIQKSQL